LQESSAYSREVGRVPQVGWPNPFVENGVVRGWEIREWNEGLAP
jgi:hypothetical protein